MIMTICVICHPPAGAQTERAWTHLVFLPQHLSSYTMSEEEASISLIALYSRALKAASNASSLPTIEDDTQVGSLCLWCLPVRTPIISIFIDSCPSCIILPPQAVVNSALKDLNLLSARVQSLNLFSPNEALDELSTRNLLYITLPFILAEVELHARSTKRDERLERLRRAYVCIAFSFFRCIFGYLLIHDKRLNWEHSLACSKFIKSSRRKRRSCSNKKAQVWSTQPHVER